MNDHGQIDIHLWIFNSFERSVSYILRGSSVLRPKEWHHLCIGIDGESNTVYSNLVITRFMCHLMGVVALAASKRHALSKWHAATEINMCCHLYSNWAKFKKTFLQQCHKNVMEMHFFGTFL